MYVHACQTVPASKHRAINPAFLPPEKHERVMCRRVMNIMVTLRTHFLSTQTALQTLNIDSFSICQLSYLVWLDLRRLPLASVASQLEQEKTDSAAGNCDFNRKSVGGDTTTNLW